MRTGRNSPDIRASTSCSLEGNIGLEMGYDASDVAGQVGVATSGAEVAGALAQLFGAFVLLRLSAAVDEFHDRHVVERLALGHVLNQADAKTPRVGGHDVAAVVAGGFDQFTAIHLDVAEVDVIGQAGSDVVDEHVPEAGVQFSALEDDDAVLGGQLGVVHVEVVLAVFREDDAVHGETALAEHIYPLQVLFHGGTGVIGCHGVRVQIKVGQRAGLRRRNSQLPPTVDYIVRLGRVQLGAGSTRTRFDLSLRGA